MIASKHYAMLEHGSVYLSIPDTISNDYLIQVLIYNKFTHSRIINHHYNFSTNLRVLIEKDILDACKPYMCDFNKEFHYYDRRVTVHFTTQIAVSREANRHRVNSMAEQSTRYCNYSKDKFNNSIAINVPEWLKNIFNKHTDDNYGLDYNTFMKFANAVYEGTATDYENWFFANLVAEKAYMNLIKNKRQPQEARVVLPLDTNTELVHTAFISDWEHFFDLRALSKTGKAHPDMVAVAKPLYEEFKKRRYIK